MEVDQIICDIIKTELNLSESRVVVYGQNYIPPKDAGIYIIVKTKRQHVVASVNRFNQSTNKEDKSTSSFIDLEIEITSKNRTAYTRKEEVVMSLTSTYSVQKQEQYHFKLFRGDILDLTFIEGASSLYRFNIPVKATYLKKKSSSVTYFDKQRANEIEIERK